MTSAVAEKRNWSRIVKLSSIALVAVGVAFVVGLYLVAPQLQRAADTYLPATLASMPAAVITVATADGTSAVLVVRVADSADARSWGLRQVGTAALATTMVLYDQLRELTTRTTYTMTGLRAPLELAVMRADGTVTSVQRVAQNAASAVVTDRHRWVLAAKEGLLSSMGVVVGSKLSFEQIRRLN